MSEHKTTPWERPEARVRYLRWKARQIRDFYRPDEPEAAEAEQQALACDAEADALVAAHGIRELTQAEVLFGMSGGGNVH